MTQRSYRLFVFSEEPMQRVRKVRTLTTAAAPGVKIQTPKKNLPEMKHLLLSALDVSATLTGFKVPTSQTNCRILILVGHNIDMV